MIPSLNQSSPVEQAINTPTLPQQQQGSLRSKFGRVVSQLSGCLPGSAAHRGFAPLASVRKQTLLRQLHGEDHQFIRGIRAASSEMTVEELSDFVTAFRGASTMKKFAMQKAVELGGSAFRFVVDEVNGSWAQLPDSKVFAAVSLFAVNGPLETEIRQRADLFFNQHNTWVVSGLRRLSPAIKDLNTAKQVVDVLMDKPWSAELLEALINVGAESDEVLGGFLSVFELGGEFEQQVREAVIGSNSNDMACFLCKTLGDKNLSPGQHSALVNMHLSMGGMARKQTVGALFSGSGLSGLVKNMPGYWKNLSQLERTILINLANASSNQEAEVLGALADDSEGIIMQRPLVLEIINRAEIDKVKRQHVEGSEVLNNAYEDYIVQLKETLTDKARQLKLEGKSAQVPELAASFLNSKHFESDSVIFGMTLREAVGAVALLGGPAFDHLPWKEEYSRSSDRKPAIENELIQQFADCRVGNGDQPSCYEGCIEHTVLSLEPFMDLAPPAPKTPEFFNVLPRVFRGLLDALVQEPASKEAVVNRLLKKKGEGQPLQVSDYYREFEP